MSYFVTHHLDQTMPEQVERIARFVGASVDGIALRSGTTEAMNVIASGLHEQLGKGPIEARARALAARLRAGLERLPGVEVLPPADPSMLAAIVSFRAKGLVPRTLGSELRREQKIIVRTVSHPHIGLEACRVCTQIWNTEEQVDLLLGALKAKLTKVSRGYFCGA